MSFYYTNLMQINNLYIIGAVIALLAISLLIKLRVGKGAREKLLVQLIQANKLTHDTIIFTFLLPKNRKRLGLKVGQHLEIQANIKGEIVKRKYTPISSIDKVGSFDLLLKIYRPIQQFPNGGKMSCYLADLPIHSKINIVLPFGKFNYTGKQNTKIADFEGNVVQKKYKNLYMVAGGTGITPIFQIIQYCCDKQSEEERPELHILFANRSENDILMKDVLDKYAQKNYKVKVAYSVDRSITNDWTGFVGFVDEEKVKKTVPQQINNTLFISCGPPPLCNNCEKIWKNMGIPNERIFRF